MIFILNRLQEFLDKQDLLVSLIHNSPRSILSNPFVAVIAEVFRNSVDGSPREWLLWELLVHQFLLAIDS